MTARKITATPDTPTTATRRETRRLVRQDDRSYRTPDGSVVAAPRRRSGVRGYVVENSRYGTLWVPGGIDAVRRVVGCY